MKRSCLLTVIVLMSFCLSAQEEAPAYRHSINVRPLNFFGSRIGANYEYLIAPKHGVVLDARLKFPSAATSGYNVGLSWRNHTKGTMRGFFWGVFANYSLLNSSAEVTSNDTTTEYPFEIKSFKLGANLGKRWMITDFGLNFTLRGGYGYPLLYDFTWTEGNPAEVPEETERLIEGIGKILSGFDAEISIGYAF